MDATAAPPRLTCYRHPDRETGVRCQRCGRPVCPACLVQAPVGVQCVECVRAAVRGSRQALDSLSPAATYVLIGINVAIYALGARLAPAYGLFGPAVAAGEWWRLLTSGFIHAGLLHLGFNMVALYMFGAPLERAIGRSRYLLIYLVALLAGSAGALVASPGALTVGASGAIFGLFGALLAAQRAAGIPLRAGGLLPVLVLNLVFTLATPGVSVGGHVGGLLGGLAAGAIVFNRTLRGAGAQGRLTALLALVTLAAVLGAGGLTVAAMHLP